MHRIIKRLLETIVFFPTLRNFYRKVRNMQVPRYMAYDEGCLECGEPSGVIGFYDNKVDADLALEKASNHQKENWMGQHWMHVIDLWNPEMSEHSDKV